MLFRKYNYTKMKILLIILYMIIVSTNAQVSPTINLQPTPEPTRDYTNYNDQQMLSLGAVIAIQAGILGLLGLVGVYLDKNYDELRKIF